ncbi:MAG: hypothetical protein K2K64_04355, partial [Muribaculaceae bacterium]|nr:hypothetical protein [Muribaculaceae bacterium]
ICTTRQDGLKSVMDFDGKDNLVNLSSGVGSCGWFLSNDAASRGYRDAGVIPQFSSATMTLPVLAILST